MEAINVDLIPGKANAVCHVSQYDIGRTIRLNLFEGGSVYTLAGTETLTVAVRKPDGNVATEAVTNTSSSYVEIVTTQQMDAVAGCNLCELSITSGADVIGTANFYMEVELDPLDGGIASDSFIHNLNQQIYDAVADQYDSNNVIFDATPTAGHGQPYTVTSEGIKNAIPTELDDLSDVTYTGSPVSGEAVVWDGTKWTNGTVSTVGTLDDLSDVDTTGKAEADSLRYNSTAQEWQAKPTTVYMSQADFEALGGDYSGYENVYIVTDGTAQQATAEDVAYDDTETYSVDTVGAAIQALTYRVGDSLDIRFGYYSGSLTGSKKIITFWIPSPRPIDYANANDCIISNAGFRVYNTSGSESIAAADGTWSFTVREHGIQAQFTLTNAITSNDGEIVAYFSSSTILTFKHT